MNTFDPEMDYVNAVPQAKKIKSSIICPIHHRKALTSFDYDNDGVNAYVTRYCCLDLAKQVSAAFLKAKIFNHVYIQNHDGTYTEVLLSSSNG